MSDLYNRIETLCKEHGTNITLMCRESGAPRASLSDLKMGRTNGLNTSTLSKIATHFNVSVDYLLGKENEKSPSPIEGNELTENKKALMQLVRNCPEEDADRLLQIMKLFLDNEKRGH